MSKRICLIGAPGCGKSTLSAAMFSALKARDHVVELVDEFIRRDIQVSGPMQSVWEQYRTRQHQKELEDAVPGNVDFVICDSGTLTPYFYSVLYVDRTHIRQRLVLQDMYRYLIDDLFLNRYDLIFYLPIIVGTNTDDGTRYQSSAEIAELDDHMRLVFTRLYSSPSIHHVAAPFANRLDEVLRVMSDSKILT